MKEKPTNQKDLSSVVGFGIGLSIDPVVLLAFDIVPTNHRTLFDRCPLANVQINGSFCFPANRFDRINNPFFLIVSSISFSSSSSGICSEKSEVNDCKSF